MEGMFQQCNELEYLDLSNLDTSNVEDMAGMFNKCYKLKEIKGINNFDTSKITNMILMFNLCKELEYLDLSNFNTSEVNNMGWMFNECNKLKEIKGINNFDTSKVIKMTAMFQDCFELEYLDLSNFKISNDEEIGWMFNHCYNLKEIQGINNFDDVIMIKNKEKIFNGCYNLKYLNNTIGNSNVKYIIITFETSDRSIEYDILCFISDIFITIEEKLLDEFPELKNKQIYYTVNRNIINKLDSLEKNNIKNSDSILINYY